MLTGYLERSSSHGPMLAYLMLHLQVGIRTQTRTEIAILSLLHNSTTLQFGPWTICIRCARSVVVQYVIPMLW